MPEPGEVQAPITLVALLFVHPGRQAEFERFEAQAAAIMHRHGGAIERRIALAPAGDPAQPDELHLVTFPSAQALDDYRQDPELQALAGLRAQAIRHTVVWRGADAAPLLELSPRPGIG